MFLSGARRDRRRQMEQDEWLLHRQSNQIGTSPFPKGTLIHSLCSVSPPCWKALQSHLWCRVRVWKVKWDKTVRDEYWEQSLYLFQEHHIGSTYLTTLSTTPPHLPIHSSSIPSLPHPKNPSSVKWRPKCFCSKHVHVVIARFFPTSVHFHQVHSCI